MEEVVKVGEKVVVAAGLQEAVAKVVEEDGLQEEVEVKEVVEDGLQVAVVKEVEAEEHLLLF